MPSKANNIIPDLKQIYHISKTFFSGQRVIVMTTEIFSNCSYVQVFIAFVYTNNLCCFYIKKAKILIKYCGASYAQ